jgi:hypothetical protein
VRIVRVTPGEPLPEPPEALDGAVIARDLAVAGARWGKGRQLTAADLALLARGDVHGRGPWAGATPTASTSAVTLLVPEAGDIHEDDAAMRVAHAVAGPGLVLRGPAESRIDLLAVHRGAVRVRASRLARIDAIDGMSVFSVLDGQLVAEGTLVASVKTGPHLVPEEAVARAEAVAAGGAPVVEVRPYRTRRVAAVVKETLAPVARARFEAALRAKVESLGSEVVAIAYVTDEKADVAAALRRFTRGPDRVDLVVTAGAASSDPGDPVFVAFAEIGGRITSHGVPAHPGSMLWLGRAGQTAFLGLATCGAYSKATAADLLLPWILVGEPPSRRTAARLGHGGILTRDMRFRFPAYARELEAPEG